MAFSRPTTSIPSVTGKLIMIQLLAGPQYRTNANVKEDALEIMCMFKF